MNPLKVCIVGTGPAALMSGSVLAEKGFEVHFFDQKKAPARKFLVAGHGGFNLTHSESIDEFVAKYSSETIRNAVREFTNRDFIDFLQKIGIPTCTGSSGKIFPEKGIKPIDVLTKWIDHLKEYGASFHMEHQLINFTDECAIFVSRGEEVRFFYNELILAMGGASWSKTGSDGKWIELLSNLNIECIPFTSSNSGYVLKNFSLSSLEGEVLKNCEVQSGSIRKKGDVVITSYGLEGAPIYATNFSFRNGQNVFIDLKPDVSLDRIIEILGSSSNRSEGLKQLKLGKGAIQLIKNTLTKEEFMDAHQLANVVKHFKLEILGLRPLDEVISTVGGVSMDEVNANLELIKKAHVYCIGEMLDWDAPTGGYLIQAAVSTGFVAARSIALS